MDFKKNIHYNRDFENAVLGACLIEPTAIGKAYHLLTPEMFYYEDHQIVFLALQEMHENNIPIDLITVTDYIERVKSIPFIENYQVAWFLCQKTNAVVSDGHMLYHCSVIKKMWSDRELIKITNSGSHISSLEELQRKTADIKSQTDRTALTLNFKIMRFLLRHATKRLIKSTIEYYGKKTIQGTTTQTIQVDSVILVYLMWLAYPAYTWTILPADDYFDKAKCKSAFPDGARVDGSKDSRILVTQFDYPQNW